jgi:hypothetical protein
MKEKWKGVPVWSTPFQSGFFAIMHPSLVLTFTYCRNNSILDEAKEQQTHYAPEV